MSMTDGNVVNNPKTVSVIVQNKLSVTVSIPSIRGVGISIAIMFTLADVLYIDR